MWQKVLLGLLVLLALAFAAASVFSALCPDYEGLSTPLMAIAGGCLAVAVLLETRRRANAAEKAVGQTEKALDQTKESIVQKTFSDAITHLGHESESVVLGGIHSLLDLAKKNSDYRPRVFNILCAHIKTTTATEEYQKKYKEEPSTTIQTLLTLLFKGEEYNIFPVSPVKYIADLSGAYLAASDLIQARLQGSNLIGVKLQGARLGDAQLQEADLRRAQLQEAQLSGAQLQHADLRGAQLQEADLKRAQLQEAYLWGAKLQEADLRGAQLQCADLSEAQLQMAHLFGAHLQHADLSNAQLQHADLRGNQHANLRGTQHADVSGAQLQEAYFRRAQLQGADFRGALLQGADLTEAKLQGADLTEAKLQGAKLRQAEMQGACMHRTHLPHETQMGRSDLRGVSSAKLVPFIGFKRRIESRIGQETDLAEVMLDEVKYPNLATPKNEGTAKTGSYTKEEADRWIKEYEEALNWKKHKD